MNKDKQITEMAEFMTEGARPWAEDAEALYNAGYRKASEVAREVIDDARRVLLNMVLANATGERIDLEKEFENIVKKYTQN